MRYALLCVLVACGGSSSPGDDDDLADAMLAPDAGGPDAQASGTVQVTVYNPYGQLEAGAHVLVNRADGSLVSDATTDASGVLEVAVGRGDMLSVVRMYASVPTTWTWVGVAPGDVYVAGHAIAADFPQPFGNVIVSFPPAFAGASFYRAESGCEDEAGTTGDPTQGVAYTLVRPCNPLAGPVPVAAQALDAQGYPVAYSTRAQVAVPQNGLVQATMGAWQTSFDHVHLTVSGSPPELGADDVVIYFMGTVESPGGRDGIFTTPRVTAASTADLDLVGGLGMSVVATAVQHLFGSDRSSRNVMVRRAAQPSGDWAVDLASDFLPEIISSETTTTEAGQARPTMHLGLAQGASLAAADGQLFTMYWLDPAFDSRRWTAIVPPGTDSVTMPEMPAELSAIYQPQPGDELHRPVAAAFEADTLPGYDAFRPLLGEVPTPNSELQLGRQILPTGPFIFRMTVSTASPV